MIDKKKRAAAIAAVTACIGASQEAALPAADRMFKDADQKTAWRVSGRQEMMQLRNMMQLKTFHDIRRK